MGEASVRSENMRTIVLHLLLSTMCFTLFLSLSLSRPNRLPIEHSHSRMNGWIIVMCPTVLERWKLSYFNMLLLLFLECFFECDFEMLWWSYRWFELHALLDERRSPSCWRRDCDVWIRLDVKWKGLEDILWDRNAIGGLLWSCFDSLLVIGIGWLLERFRFRYQFWLITISITIFDRLILNPISFRIFNSVWFQRKFLLNFCFRIEFNSGLNFKSNSSSNSDSNSVSDSSFNSDFDSIPITDKSSTSNQLFSPRISL